jgi:5-(carboxyamino)imidazole ribonucleotide mutase
VPILGKSTDGLDSLLSMVQMPPGVPVATVAINGGRNAGILAAQIIATGDTHLQNELKKFKVRLMEESRAKNKTLARDIK